MILLHNSLYPTKVPKQVLSVAFKLWRGNKLWATKRSPKRTIDLALDYFDNIYSPIYGKRWPSIRLALLCDHKYCAVVNNFSDVDRVCTQLQNEGAVNIREVFNYRKSSITEKSNVAKRKQEKKAFYDLNKRIESIVAKTRDEEIQGIYPSGTDRPHSLNNKNSEMKSEDLSKDELLKQAKTPLEKSLAEASIDVDRQIDPSDGLSSSRLNDFVPVSKLKGKEGFVSEAEHFSFFNETTDCPVTVEPEESLNFPSHLHIYTFDQGNISTFNPPKSGISGVSDYYLMDASSIMPVLALDLEPGDTVLDMCAAPGGKSVLCFQTLYPDLIVCNDSSLSRLNRVKNVMQEYFYDWEKKIKISNFCGTAIQDVNTFSKILVDVPCTNDRHSLIENDNNIFKPSRNKERILLPELQVELLFNALKLVKEGGSVVYSTCSLNPAQNDGVVQMALQKMWEETSMKIVVKDLTKALEPLKLLFKFADPQCVRYGSLVVPYLPSNFGPMYFCKFEKLKTT